jgi:hypothetical protein
MGGSRPREGVDQAEELFEVNWLHQIVIEPNGFAKKSVTWLRPYAADGNE